MNHPSSRASARPHTETWFACSLVILVAACSGDRRAELDERHGIWQSLGYGLVLDYTGEAQVLYERTSSSCLKSSPLYAEPVTLLALSADRQRMSAHAGIDTVPVTFQRLTALPPECSNGGTPTAGETGYVADPRLDLAVFCDTFLENYAFFDLRGVDFAALCDDAKHVIGASSTSEQLREVVVGLIRPLNDGHVVLYQDPEHQYSAAAEPQVVKELRDEFLQQGAYPDFASYAAAQMTRHEQIVTDYLVGAPQSAAEGLLVWGHLDDRTGYLAIRGMANGALPGDAQIASVGEGVDQALADLGDLPSLVLDVRMNGGGHDAVGLAVAARLRSGTQEAFTVAARSGAGFTEPYRVDVSAAGPRQFAGRLVVLTSELTASAAETFLLALESRPDTFLVGETTAGVFSDMLPRTLPNGWVVTLSNERYEGPDGTCHEGIGIVPDVPVDCFSRAERDAGTDNALDAALDLL